MCGPFIDTAAESPLCRKCSHSVYKTSFSRWHQNRKSSSSDFLMLRLICRTEELPPPFRLPLRPSSKPAAVAGHLRKGEKMAVLLPDIFSPG